MFYYFLKRFFLIIPTLLGVIFLNFFIVQLTPGGPVQQVIAQIRSSFSDSSSRLGGGASNNEPSSFEDNESQIDEELVKKLEKQFGFDLSPIDRLIKMLKDYARFDFGKSYFKGENVLSLILSKMSVSLTLGLLSAFFVYLIAIPLGMIKALKLNTKFDLVSSFVIIILYAIPTFLIALFLVMFFAGGSFFAWFPLRGLVSDNFDALSWFGKIKDYMWHITLPLIAIVLERIAKITFLTKNSFLEEMNKHYVTTAFSKGLTQSQVMKRHVFKNAFLVIASGFPTLLTTLFFTSNIVIEVLFSLDGLGLLGFEAAMQRDYPLMFGILFFFTLTSLIMHIVGDFLYMFLDPRIRLNK